MAMSDWSQPVDFDFSDSLQTKRVEADEEHSSEENNPMRPDLMHFVLRPHS
uniref:Uncharacterized protein n=1 Tax=Arundo donax TaxID=35708 RepID=A0A0A8XUJ5_ARUDO